MKISRHFPAGVHPDIRRQQIVQHKRKFIRGNGIVRIKVDHLPQRVHPRVGAGSAGDCDRMAAGLFQRFLQDLLDFFKDCKGLYVEWEMKTNEKEYPPELLKKYCDEVYAMVTAAQPADALFIFTSFDPRPLLYLHQNHPEAELMLITGKPCTQETVDLTKMMGLHRLAATVNGSSRSALKYAHEKGLTVNLWPGEKPEDTVLGWLLGADYLCTDIPLQVKQFIEDYDLPIVCR